MGLQDDIKQIKALMVNNKVKEKKFKFPFGKKVGKGQRKNNYVTTLIINENGNYQFKKYQIEDQTILHDLVPRIANSGYSMFDKKGNPLIILPSWSVEPFSPLKNYQESLTDGRNVNGYKLLMTRMEQEKITGKKKMGKILPWVIGGVLVAIILYAVLSGGGGS